MINARKFIGATLLVLVALLLTFKFKTALGWSPDFIIPVLAAAGFLLDIYALALLVLLTLWILNWQSGLPVELLLVATAPFLAWAGKKFMPSASWLTLIGVVGAAEISLYAIADGAVFWSSLGFIVSNTAFAILFGLALVNLLEYVYSSK